MNTKPSTIHRDTVAKLSEAIDNALVSAVHYMDANPDVNLDHIVVGIAEARVYCLAAANMAMVADRVIDIGNDQPRIYADELGDPDGYKQARGAIKLPKLKPQGHDKPKYKPGIGKLFKGAINFDCPTCKADAFTSCFKFEGPGAHPKLTNERNDGTFYHRKRQDEAKKYNDRVRKANILP